VGRECRPLGADEKGELKMHRYLMTVAAVTAALAIAGTATGAVGTSFPPGFETPTDASLGVPVIGFGADGLMRRTPVILLHGNNDTPYPTARNPYGDVHDLAAYLERRGYRPSELWGLGYQGDQCDLIASPTNRSGEAHSTVANVPDLRAFVRAVRRYTGAKRVDIVGHSLGGTLAREWMRQDNAYHRVGRLVTIDSPHHGIVNCSPNPLNYFQLAALGGFTPDSAVCQEYGAADTPFLRLLNRHETRGPTRYLALRNADTSFVYFSKQDGFFAPVPAEDRTGAPHDFSVSAVLHGRRVLNLDFVGQGVYDPILGTAHLGILNSPPALDAVADFLLAKRHEDDDA
jgi:pimeloyl-ACP methyl ester carboxylesterase